MTKRNDSHSVIVAGEILAERRRQRDGEGFTVDRDDGYRDRELARAAGSYALHSGGAPVGAETYWPWAAEWWKPSDPRRNLLKAGALIVAEIERLDRLAAKAAGK